MCSSYFALSDISFVLLDNVGERSTVVFFQYLFKDDEHKNTHVNHLDNGEKKVSYRRIFPSPIDKMKLSEESNKRQK